MVANGNPAAETPATRALLHGVLRPDGAIADLLCSMLDRARSLQSNCGGKASLCDPKMAAEFYRQLSVEERRCLVPDDRIWQPCDRPWSAAAAVRGDPLEPGLPLELYTVPAVPDPAVARAVQALLGCEVSADLVYDTRTDRFCTFLTHGCRGGVTSNLLLYFWFEGHYAVLPVFHTHPGCYSDLGLKLPSTADFKLMSAVRDYLGGGEVGERLLFLDGTSTEYGITADNRWYYRRQGTARAGFVEPVQSPAPVPFCA